MFAGVVAVAVTALTVDAGTAYAKILPYRLEVNPTRARVGQAVTIAVTLDAQSSLGDSFEREIAVFRASTLTEHGWPRRRARPVERVTMELVDAAEPAELAARTYRGTFTATRRGRYVVVGTTARPERGAHPRCLPAAAGTDLRCWPSPVALSFRAAS